MRLLMTTDTVGGVWTYTRELVEGLLRTDASVQVHLLAVGGDGSVEQHGWLRFMRERDPQRFAFTFTSIPLEWEQRNHEVDALDPRLIEVADRFQPDVLHSNQFCYGALPVRCPRLVVAHSDVLSWHQAVHGAPPAPSAWLARYEHLVRTGLTGTDALVAPTRWMLDAFLEAFAFDGETRVIPNGIALRADLNRERRLQALTAGRLWDEGKNIAMLQDLAPCIPVRIVGSTEHAEAELAWRSHPEIDLAGSMPHRDLLALFAQSALYLSTARYEPFGLAALEAAASGCALLAFDIPSMREVWRDAALYFRNAEELRDLMRYVAASPGVLLAAQRRTHARAQRYTRQAMAEAYLALYRQLLQGTVTENATVA